MDPVQGKENQDSRSSSMGTVRIAVRAATAVLLAVIAAVCMLQSTQAAAPAPLEQSLTCPLPSNGQNSSPSDGTALLVNIVEGSVVEPLNTWVYTITNPDGSKFNAFCTDARRARSSNTPSLCFAGYITNSQVLYLMSKYPPSLTSRVDQAARQAAVWHYINGYTLQSPDSTNGNATIDAAVLAAYNAILADVDTINDSNLPGYLRAGPLALTITPPTADNTLPAGADSPFTVQLTKGGFPVAGVPVTVTTTFGTLNQATATTNASGQAVFTVTSTANGTANLAAVAAVATYTVPEFLENQPSGLWQPYGGPTTTVESVNATAVVTWTGALLPGQITLTKSATGTTAPWSFSFTLDGANQQTVTNAAPSVTWGNLTPNQTYTLAEVTPLPDNWAAGAIGCTVNGTAISDAAPATPGFQILVTSGAAVACTANNVYTPPGQITLTKTASGTAAPWAFSFSLTGGNLSGDNQQTATNTAPVVTWSNLAANQVYTLSEVLPLPPNWTAGATACTVNGAPTPDADGALPGFQVLVTPGAAVACTAANTYTPPPGQVSLTKSVTGTTAAWAFSFTLNSDQKTATNTTPTVTWSGLIPDQVYTLSEVLPLPPNYTAGPIACAINGAPAADADATQPGFQILVTPGAVVTCTAENTYTPPPGQINVTKTATGATGPWSFTFTLNGGSPQVATTGTPTVTWSNLTPNQTYTVAEESPGSEWVAGAFSCTVNGTPTADADPGAAGFQVVVTPGAVVACTVNNTRVPPPPNSGTITLTKSVAGPVTTPWSFNFTLNDVLRQATNAAPVVTWSNLTPNQTYTLTEIDAGLPNWTAGPITCAVNGVTTPDADPGAAGYQILVTPGASIECAVTNTYTPPALGQISLTKSVVGTVGSWAFAFTLDGANRQVATQAAPTITWGSLTPNQTYTLAEENPGAGWVAGPIACTLNGEPLPDASTDQGYQVLVTPGASVLCTATNTAQPGQITVTKVVTTTTEDWSFVFQLQDQPGTKVATKAQPTVTWENLTPGRTYDLLEVDPGTDWTEESYECALLNGEPVGTLQPNRALRIPVQPGDHVLCLKYNSNVPGTGLPVTPEPSAKVWLFLPAIRH